MQNAPREHSAILSTFIKLPFVFKTFVLSIFEQPLKTGFTVCDSNILFSDLAVGAPYGGEDGRGAVYIYHGSMRGIITDVQQVCYLQCFSSNIL